MKQIPWLKKVRWTDVLFGIFLLLLILPQTRRSLQIGANKLKVLLWTPGIEKEADRAQVAPFKYSVRNQQGAYGQIPVAQGELTFFSFWATWCPPCVAEMPSIASLYEDYGDRVNFILVTRENPEKVNTFLEKRGWDVPVYFHTEAVPEVLKSGSLPTTYVIDGEGRILIKEIGAANWNSDKVRTLLDQHLAK